VPQPALRPAPRPAPRPVPRPASISAPSPSITDLFTLYSDPTGTNNYMISGTIKLPNHFINRIIVFYSGINVSTQMIITPSPLVASTYFSVDRLIRNNPYTINFLVKLPDETRITINVPVTFTSYPASPRPAPRPAPSPARILIGRGKLKTRKIKKSKKSKKSKK